MMKEYYQEKKTITFGRPRYLAIIRLYDISLKYQAIEWLTLEKVDIIAVPWGLCTNSQRITSALEIAITKGIIVLGSASHQGSEGGIAFPARLKDVFCIGSSNG